MSRKQANKDGHLALEQGDYGQQQGIWYCMTPTGLLGNLDNHSVTEHEDGTITVSPSILIHGGEAGEWHGFLEAGKWRQV